MKRSEKSSTLTARLRKKWDDKEVDSKVASDPKASARTGNIGNVFIIFFAKRFLTTILRPLGQQSIQKNCLGKYLAMLVLILAGLTTSPNLDMAMEVRKR